MHSRRSLPPRGSVSQMHGHWWASFSQEEDGKKCVQYYTVCMYGLRKSWLLKESRNFANLKKRLTSALLASHVNATIIIASLCRSWQLLTIIAVTPAKHTMLSACVPIIDTRETPQIIIVLPQAFQAAAYPWLISEQTAVSKWQYGHMPEHSLHFHVLSLLMWEGNWVLQHKSIWRQPNNWNWPQEFAIPMEVAVLSIWLTKTSKHKWNRPELSILAQMPTVYVQVWTKEKYIDFVGEPRIKKTLKRGERRKRKGKRERRGERGKQT